MNKKNNLALFTFISFGLINLLSLSIFAQALSFAEIKLEKENTCSTTPFKMPSSVPIKKDAFINFIRVMSLPRGERQLAFSELNNEDKSTLYKVKLALQFMKRPKLTNDQGNLILKTISTVSADTYDKTNSASVAKAESDSKMLEQNAFRFFSKNEALDIFADLNGDYTPEIEVFKNYENILAFPTVSTRKQKIREISPIEKSLFWKAQMIYFLSTAEISNSQKIFIAKTFAFLTPRAFDLPNSSAIRKNEDSIRLDSLEEEAKTIFTREEAFAFFESPGIHKPVPPNNGLSFAELVKPFQPSQVFINIGLQKIVDPINLSITSNLPKAKPEICDCNYMCGALCWACGSPGGCTASPSGCGWYENQSCSRRCTEVQNCP